MNQYDLGARFYDPVLGRFSVIDPFTDFAPDLTSYRYAFDNPVSFTDPTGLLEEDECGGGGEDNPVITIELKEVNVTATYQGSSYNRSSELEEERREYVLREVEEITEVLISTENGLEERIVSDLGNQEIDVAEGEEMKPASAYDYSLEVIPGKFTDDWDYYINGGPIYMMGWRATEILWRDLTAVSNKGTVFEAGVYIFIRGYGKIAKDLFHPGGNRGIKIDILNDVGKSNYLKRVGNNPDIEVVNGLIQLNGTGPFNGRTYLTNLDAIKYLKY